MATKVIQILGLGKFQYDDTVEDFAISTDGKLLVNRTPAANNEVLRYQDIGSGGLAAPIGAAYVTIGNDGDLTSERALAVDTNLILTDGGANGSVTIGLPTTTSIDNTDSPYTALATSLVILGDTTSGNITVNLPTSVDGKHYFIKNTGTGTLTIDGNSSETIDGALTQTLTQYESLHIVGDGSNWWII